MKRKQCVLSPGSSIPGRTLRRYRERQRSRTLFANLVLASGRNLPDNQIVQSGSGLNSLTLPSNEDVQTSLESSSQSAVSGSSAEEEEASNDFNMSSSSSSEDDFIELSSSCSSLSSMSSAFSVIGNEDDGIPEFGESCWPTEDDLQFWKTPSGHDIYLSAPLSAATKTTRGDVLLMCLALGFRHSLPWTTIVDILKMINSLFGQEVIKATKYFFLKYMEAGKGEVTYHMYCHYCLRYLGKQDHSNGADLVCRCGQSLKDKKAKNSFFVTLSVEEQLKELLGDKRFVDALQYRFKRVKCQENAYEDIYDGELYKRLSAPGEPLSHWYNLSYIFNTDGFHCGGKSGKQRCWPIFVQINELPPELRPQFMLLAGLYVGSHDPNMQVYLHPFVQEANDLATEGINWYFKKKLINTKLIPLASCVDTPARSKILNMTSFSGNYGCTICMNKPKHFKKLGNRYTLPLNVSTERTHEGILLDASRAHANKTLARNRDKRRVRGVKGPSHLHNLMYFDVVKGVRPDIMHSIVLGIGKHHMSVMESHVGKEYYIGAEVILLAIQNRLLSIKPPQSLPPAPKDRFSTWKANKWLAFLLFYAVPCLHGIIPDKYVAHLSMLSSALHVFLKKSISPEDLEKAHWLLLRYIYLFQEYFGKREMVFNIHLLLHMKNSIIFLGPSWTNMAFAYEGANKHLLEFKKGSSTIAKDIVSKYLTFKALPLLCEKFASSEETLKFCQNLSGRPLLKSSLSVENILLCGKRKQIGLNDEESKCLYGKVFAHLKEALGFQKFIKNRVKYTTASYCQPKKRDDSYISVCGKTIARIEKIVRYTGGGQQSVYLLVRELILDRTPLYDGELGRASPLVRIVGEGNLLAITPDDISSQCIAIYVESGNFICEIPYGCYGHS